MLPANVLLDTTILTIVTLISFVNFFPITPPMMRERMIFLQETQLRNTSTKVLKTTNSYSDQLRKLRRQRSMARRRCAHIHRSERHLARFIRPKSAPSSFGLYRSRKGLLFAELLYQFHNNWMGRLDSGTAGLSCQLLYGTMQLGTSQQRPGQADSCAEGGRRADDPILLLAQGLRLPHPHLRPRTIRLLQKNAQADDRRRLRMLIYLILHMIQQYKCALICVYKTTKLLHTNPTTRLFPCYITMMNKLLLWVLYCNDNTI